MLKLWSHSVDKPGMRCVSCLTLLVLLATSGCADVSHFLPKVRAALGSSRAAPLQSVAMQPRVGPTPAAQPQPLPSGAIDMSGVLQGAVRLPADLQRLREAIVTGLVIISVLGITNIALMLAVFGRLRRMAPQPREFALGAPLPTPAPAAAEIGRSSGDVAPTPVRVVPAAVAAPLLVRTCACGADISSRSRTGRCRACARTATIRAKRAERVVDIPAHA